MTDTRRVLYRCRTPTDFLCPCGATARRLRKLGLDYETQRVALRRADRPEIVELTDLKFVPVLVDGDEVINDSHRIREYLDWRYGEGPESGVEGGIPESGERPSTMGADE